MENKRKHLEIIQAVISRLAGNLFFLRGWTITLITGVFAIALSKDASKGYFLLVYLLLAIFWVLDGFFLSQERRFRSLYDHVRKLEESQIDFSMKTRTYKSHRRNTWFGAMLSSTLLWFYVPLAVAIFIVVLLIKK